MKKQFIYEKDNGLYGTFHFDAEVYPMLRRNITGLPCRTFGEHETIEVSPNTIDGLCAINDFLHKHGFAEVVKNDGTFIGFWKNAITKIIGR